LSSLRETDKFVPYWHFWKLKVSAIVTTMKVV